MCLKTSLNEHQGDVHQFLDHGGILAFAHRGGAEEWPENTMPAFQGAVDLGYRYLETDAYATRDGKLLAFHDDVLERLTAHEGRVAETDYAIVKEARIHGKEPIPLLEDLLGAWPGIRLNIDPKHDEAVAPLIETIKRTDALDRVCIGSFSGRRLQQMRAVFGAALCTSMGPLEVIRLRLASLGAPAGAFAAQCAQVPTMQYGLPIVDRLFVKAAEKRGLQVHVWTINNRTEMLRLLDLGVHGIMTDRPSLLKEVLQDRGQWA